MRYAPEVNAHFKWGQSTHFSSESLYILI